MLPEIVRRDSRSTFLFINKKMGAHSLHGNALEALQISAVLARRVFIFDFIRLTDSDRPD